MLDMVGLFVLLNVVANLFVWLVYMVASACMFASVLELVSLWTWVSSTLWRLLLIIEANGSNRERLFGHPEGITLASCGDAETGRGRRLVLY